MCLEFQFFEGTLFLPCVALSDGGESTIFLSCVFDTVLSGSEKMLSQRSHLGCLDFPDGVLSFCRQWKRYCRWTLLKALGSIPCNRCRLLEVKHLFCFRFRQHVCLFLSSIFVLAPAVESCIHLSKLPSSFCEQMLASLPLYSNSMQSMDLSANF